MLKAKILLFWDEELTLQENAKRIGVSESWGYHVARIYHLNYAECFSIKETLQQYRNRIGSVSNYPMPQIKSNLSSRQERGSI